MRIIEVSLVEFPEGNDDGIRLLGRTNDPDVVNYVRDQIAQERRRDLSRLTSSPVSLVPEDGGGG